jgi:phosphoribosyl 1,2-cyclic phosphodiesterase
MLGDAGGVVEHQIDGAGRVMRVTVLGSGSGGNATLVESGATRVLIDAGFSGRDIERAWLRWMWTLQA